MNYKTKLAKADDHTDSLLGLLKDKADLLQLLVRQMSAHEVHQAFGIDPKQQDEEEE